MSQVSAGTALAQQAGATMQEIVGSVTGVRAIISDISSASNEQASRVSAVSSAIKAIETSTVSSVEVVDETSAAALALQSQASSLHEVAGIFVVEEAGRAVGR